MIKQQRPYRGVFPVVPTIFDRVGGLDLEGQKRCIDFMIDAGSHGLCILANFSEQFVLSDTERETLTKLCLEHVAGRVPVIVTTTHFSSRVCAERCKAAEDLGAAMVMVMPPYHGATLRIGENQIRDFLRVIATGLSIPIMIQDAPIAGTPMSPAFLASLAKSIENIRYFKIETAQAASKLRDLIALGGDTIEGPWDGEEAITLMADLDAGCTGAMTGGGYPDGIRQIMDPWQAGDRKAARAAYAKWLPLINYENRQCGFATAKILMEAGGIIRTADVRHPLLRPSPTVEIGLLELAREFDVMALHWAK